MAKRCFCLTIQSNTSEREAGGCFAHQETVADSWTGFTIFSFAVKTFCWGGVEDEQRHCGKRFYNNICATDRASKCTNETGRVDSDSTTLIPLALYLGFLVRLWNPSASITALVQVTIVAAASVCFWWSAVIAHKRLMPEAAITVGIICSSPINQPGWTPAGFSGAAIHSKVWERAMFTSLLVKNNAGG